MCCADDTAWPECVSEAVRTRTVELTAGDARLSCAHISCVSDTRLIGGSAAPICRSSGSTAFGAPVPRTGPITPITNLWSTCGSCPERRFCRITTIGTPFWVHPERPSAGPAVLRKRPAERIRCSCFLGRGRLVPPIFFGRRFRKHMKGSKFLGKFAQMPATV